MGRRMKDEEKEHTERIKIYLFTYGNINKGNSEDPKGKTK